jgi:hypothetical protein
VFDSKVSTRTLRLLKLDGTLKGVIDAEKVYLGSKLSCRIPTHELLTHFLLIADRETLNITVSLYISFLYMCPISTSSLCLQVLKLRRYLFPASRQLTGWLGLFSSGVRRFQYAVFSQGQSSPGHSIFSGEKTYIHPRTLRIIDG